MGFVQFKGAEGNGTSMSVTMTSAPTNGNVLVAFATSAIGGETIGTGWTNIIIQGENTLDGCWAIKTAGASESTTQTPYTQSSGLYTVGVWEFSGVSATNDGFAVTENVSATPPTVTVTGTPGSGGDYAVVGSAFNGNSTGSPTITQGGTSITIDGQNLTGNSAVWGHLNSAPSGSQSYVCTFGTGTNRCTGGLLFLKPSGGTPHTQAITGVTSFSGATPKATTHKITGPVLSFVGSVKNATVHAVSGAVSFAGSLKNATVHNASAVSSFVGSITRATTHKLTAVQSFAGVMNRARALAAVLSFLGAASRTTVKQQTGALQFSGSVAKATKHVTTAVLSFAGSVARATIHGFAGALSFVGAYVTTKGKSLTGSLSFSGATQKPIAKQFAGVISSAGATAKATLYKVSGALSFVGAILRSPIKALAASALFAGSAATSKGKGLLGTLSFSTASSGKTVGHLFSGALTFLGNVTQPGNVFTNALSAILSFGAAEVVQFSATNSLTGTSATVTMGKAPTQGNLLVAFFMTATGGEVIGTGWTNVTIQGENTLDGCWAYKVAGAGESTSQTPYTMGAGNWACGIWEIYGALSGNDGYSVASVAPATSPSITSSATAGINGDIALVMSGINRSAVSTGVLTGVTVDGTNNVSLSYVAGHTNVQAGSNSFTCTWNGTGPSAPTMGILYVARAETFLKTTGKALAAAGSFTGSITRGVAHAFTAAVSFAGTVVWPGFLQFFNGTLGLAGSQTRGTTANKNLGVLSLNGSATVKAVAKLFSAVVSPTVVFKRAYVTSVSAATLTFIGAISNKFGFLQPLLATLSFSGSQTKVVSKALSAISRGVGVLAKAATRGVFAAQSFAGAMAKTTVAPLASAVLSFIGTRTFGRFGTFGAGLSFSGSYTRNIVAALTATYRALLSITKAVTHNYAGALSFAGSIFPNIGRFLSAILTYSGSDIVHTIGHFISAALLQAGSVAKNYVPTGLFASLQNVGVFLKGASPNGETAGSISFSGSANRYIQAVRTATTLLTGQLPRAIMHGFSAVVSFAGSVVRAAGGFVALTATLGLSGSINKATSNTATGVLGVIGSQARNTGRLFQATIAVSAGFAKSFGIAAAAALSLSATVFRGKLAAFTATISFAGAQVKTPAKKLLASLPFVGAMGGRTLVIVRTAVSRNTGSLPRSVVHGLPGAVLTFGGAIRRGFTRAFSAVISFIGSVVRQNGQLPPPVVYVLDTSIVTGITLGTQIETNLTLSDMSIESSLTINLPPLA